MSKTIEELAKVLRVDDTTTANITYIGRSLPGAIETEPVWQIQTIDVSSGNSVMGFPDGNSGFKFKFSEITTYNYL